MSEEEDRPRYRPADSDNDGRPGGARESRAYDRRYNPQGEDEYTNLPENAKQLEEAFAERAAQEREAELERQREEMQHGAGGYQYWPRVGRFMIPEENTFAAHQELVRGSALEFNPAEYAEFDAVLAEHAKRPEIFDPSHPEYANYATLRENLAVLRNDIMGIYMNDASFDPGDERYIPHLRDIAAELGDAMRHDKSLLGRALFPHLDTQLLNMEGDGAAYAYRHLLKQQRDPGFFASVIRDIRNLLSLPLREWELPPVGETAFSNAALDAPPPRRANAGLSEPARERGFAQENSRWQDFVEQQRAAAMAEHHAGLA